MNCITMMNVDQENDDSVVRYLDYRTQAEERRKELTMLRKKCLANAGGKLVEVPSDV